MYCTIKNFKTGYRVTLTCRKYCATNYKSTLLLPTTRFRHKFKPQDRRNEDFKIEKAAKFTEAYDCQRETRTKSTYILHDGPPYANGDVHIGHAVNKVLKDITLRYQVVNGHPVHYKPGWDCHGLPIELKVLKENADKIDKIDLRKRAYTFSQKALEKQKQSFLEWGMLSNFKKYYVTCDPKYVTEQLNMFQDLYDKGVIIRDHKPVFWSPQNRTSLAEAELEYHSDHVSPSVFVKFSVQKCPDVIKSKLVSGSKLSLLIWTTTPWSLPSNQAVCYSSEKQYCIATAKDKNEYLIIATDLIPYLQKTLKTELEVHQTFEGSVLKEIVYFHPISKHRECSLVPGHHVTMDKGTGLVHMAPNHGFDDYNVALRQNIPLDVGLVDEQGCYNSDAGTDLQGQLVLDQGAKTVLSILGNDILHQEDYVHSYPYDWRSKTPVIIRSCYQWFLDVDQVRDKALECLQTVKVIPEHFKKVFQNQLESCPQWCISRQRAWGVPIPAFYSNDRKDVLVHRDVTKHLCSLIEKNGIHSWWSSKTDDLLPKSLRSQLNIKENEYERGFDIMDIWFDSGISWKCVLPDSQVSDLCIEGVDQIRGWFNSSLLTSVALRGSAPYKSLFLHGFVTDSEGRKMSKSEGNVISPDDILKGSKSSGFPAYGVDVLRWWVASHACQAENVPVKLQIFEECAQNLFKIRNVFKFLLSNINNFDMFYNTISSKQLLEIDLYMLHKLLQFQQKIMAHYTQMQYKNVAKEVLNFITNDVSAFYCHIIKDRLYCDAKVSQVRLSCQTALCFTLSVLMQVMAPVCPHLTEEVFCNSPFYDKNSFITGKSPNLEEYLKGSEKPVSVEYAVQIREAILKATAKTANFDAIISSSSNVLNTLKNLQRNEEYSGLTEVLQVSNAVLKESIDEISEESLNISGNFEGIAENRFTVSLMETKLQKCPRCRLHKSCSADSLCCRCSGVVASSPSHSVSSLQSSA